jgi:hypothetical protein
MVRPTPATETTSEAPPAGPVARDEAAERARAFLEMLGRSDHPDAGRDPLHALYQVAVDFRCSAHGYRDLYLARGLGTPRRP